MRLIDSGALMKRMCAQCNIEMADAPCEPEDCFVRTVIMDAPTIDAVPVGVLDQVRWERDVAIAQLNDYGVSFGEKADCVKVVRCRACNHGKTWKNAFGIEGFKCDLLCVDLSPEAFCSYGEKRDE